MKKILVADDEEGIRILYQEELEEEGYEVKVAANGKETLELLDTFLPFYYFGYQDARYKWS